MSQNVVTIALPQLALAFIPVVAVLLIFYHWSLGTRTAVFALSRMLGQLLVIGYFLTYLFETDQALVVVAVLTVMVIASSWIALRTVEGQRRQLYPITFLSVALGGGATLLVITRLVLELDPWYLPRYMIPLAGMIFANTMNSVSLAADRLIAELRREVSFVEARSLAMGAAMIPNINTLFAVGLVSLPGMMTGQILSGVSPLIAVRYQIMVMCMIFASAGLATALFLALYPRVHRKGGAESPDEHKAAV